MSFFANVEIVSVYTTEQAIGDGVLVDLGFVTVKTERTPNMSVKVPLFLLGRIVATPGALDALETAGQAATEFLARHICGDWGKLCDEDRRENEHSLKHHLRLLSAYALGDGTKIWVITEASREVTTLLLPSEY